MKQKREKMRMEPGVKYRGWGMVNEYGEVTFEASQPRHNPNAMRIVKETEDVTLYESLNYWRLTLRIDKHSNEPQPVRLKHILNAAWCAIWDLRRYM